MTNEAHVRICALSTVKYTYSRLRLDSCGMKDIRNVHLFAR